MHPGEIAHDFWTTRRALDAVDNRPAFALHFDASHFVWQDLDPVAFLGTYPDRIWDFVPAGRRARGPACLKHFDLEPPAASFDASFSRRGD